MDRIIAEKESLANWVDRVLPLLDDDGWHFVRSCAAGNIGWLNGEAMTKERADALLARRHAEKAGSR